MMRGMDRAQAQYDAMEPPDYYEPDVEAEDDGDPDDENERRAEWAREDARHFDRCMEDNE